MPEVNKSSRHSKITGDFAEHLILYWLSKHGLECARVDHVGMDLIARREGTARPMGISVKARSRNPGTEGTYLSIPNENFAKLEAACAAFGCDPYFAIMVDEADHISAFVMSAAVLGEIHPQRERVCSWKMSAAWLQRYQADSRIIKFGFASSTSQWWP